MRRLGLIGLLSVWVAGASFADVWDDLSVRGRADVASISSGQASAEATFGPSTPSAPLFAPTAIYYTATITLSDGTIITSDPFLTLEEAAQDATAIYFNSVVEVPTD